MNYTFDTAVGDGVTTAFTFGFAGPDEGYIDLKRDLRVFVNNVEVAFTTSFADPNKVFIVPAPAVGAAILVRRIMPRDNTYSDYKGGNAFTPDTLNYTALQQLYLTQELLDGFYDKDFYFKQDMNMGGHRIYDLHPAVDPKDAVNFTQLKGVSANIEAVDKKHTEWNQNQDIAIKSLQSGIGSSGVSTSIPWAVVAEGGETVISPPYRFKSAHVYRAGVRQYEVMGAFTISDNKVIFEEPLAEGEEILLDIGVNYNPSSGHLSGPTAERPTGVYVGYMYFDTTLGYPVYWRGDVWVSGDGVIK